MEKNDFVRVRFQDGDNALFAEFDTTVNENAWTGDDKELVDILNGFQSVATLRVDMTASQDIDVAIVEETIKLMGYGKIVSKPKKLKIDPNVVY